MFNQEVYVWSIEIAPEHITICYCGYTEWIKWSSYCNEEPNTFETRLAGPILEVVLIDEYVIDKHLLKQTGNTRLFDTISAAAGGQSSPLKVSNVTCKGICFLIDASQVFSNKILRMKIFQMINWPWNLENYIPGKVVCITSTRLILMFFYHVSIWMINNNK